MTNEKLNEPCTPFRAGFCLLFSIFFLLAGCNTGRITEPSPVNLTENFNQEQLLLAAQIDKLRAENLQLKQRIEGLSGISSSGLESWSVQRIQIGAYTGLRDEDKDGKEESLVVYLQPIDQDGDAIKLPGRVQVQLWNLNVASGQALLGQWQVGPEELKKRWLASFFGGNYKLTFDVTDKMSLLSSDSKGLTVKVTFSDLLSGRVFTEQKVIGP